MKIIRKGKARTYERDGIVSHLLVSEVSTGSDHLTTSLVEMNPGGVQKIHAHEPEQCYFIIEGNGLMAVGNEQSRVGPGDCIFVPSNERHGLKNDGDSALRYFSAASPSFGKESLLRLWPKDPENSPG